MAGPPIPASVLGYHPRATLLARTLGPVYGRSFGRGRVVAEAAGLIVGVVGTVWLPAIAAVALAIVLGVSAGMVVVALGVPRRVRIAQEVFAWLARAERPAFERRTGGPVPRGRDWRAWLAAHPAGSISPYPRVEILGMLGELDQARAELAAAVPPADDEERLDRTTLASWLDWLDDGQVDLAPLEDLAATLPDGTVLAVRARGARAIAEARVRLASGDAGWADPLVAFRQELGLRPTLIVLRDFHARRLVPFAVGALIAGVVGTIVGLLVQRV
jgi:hypothetical protein